MSGPLTLPLADEAATKRLGERLAAMARPGDVIALSGTLGTGKSTLARAFIRALTSPDEEVPSPTFTLVQQYDIGAEAGLVWHFDLYRLEAPDDALELDIEEAFAEGICLIEWPDRLGPHLPRRRLDLALEAGETETSRRATLTGHGSWADRLGDVSE
ncbi:tRNA threonylcarbamoyladenosine biosynthesis protein TsaE [Paramagnetospirillum marisnigri]|uniref:tRNA threonylcarbamoyladenosine biosynthesis protein TsaE n=1 Tax=Paramagnetospirillum marisnigri TaxID=1285242 RepID=A0A178MZ72_9PROT|nr:tRNA (adenosine(37)-N6)-threonylcarbamoyltransferase complex ATPase subunit type 1 TsaE [Paramagnetospirillum marisnigri]OAN55238.1 tRNA threonylcarbamoyladenosine biosynthesis protein TsaE [Paramagnetospirillum marisnigri]